VTLRFTFQLFQKKKEKKRKPPHSRRKRSQNACGINTWDSTDEIHSTVGAGTNDSNKY